MKTSRFQLTTLLLIGILSRNPLSAASVPPPAPRWYAGARCGKPFEATMSDRTVDVPWTIGDEAFVVTASADEIRAVRLAFSTRPTAEAKREFFAEFDGDQEDAFRAVVDAALADSPVASIYLDGEGQVTAYHADGTERRHPHMTALREAVGADEVKLTADWSEVTP